MYNSYRNHCSTFYILECIYKLLCDNLEGARALECIGARESKRLMPNRRAQYDMGPTIYLITRSTKRQWRRLGAEFGGDEIFFRGPRFLNDIFSEIFTPKISDDLFFSHRAGFLIFCIFTVLSHI